MKMFVQIQPIFNTEVSLASYYNSMSENVQLLENNKCKISHKFKVSDLFTCSAVILSV